MATKTKISALFWYLFLASTLIGSESARSYRHTVTLTDRAASFVAYENLISSKVTQLSFKFKTYCRHCLLMYVDNKNGASDKENYMLLTLLKGHLNIYIHKGSNFEVLKKSVKKMSRDLNDIQWHQIDIKISGTKSFITIDNESKMLVDNTIKLSSLLYFGGVEDIANISTAANSKVMLFTQRFVGCITSVTFLHLNGSKLEAREVKRNKAITGCLDACSGMSCEHKGRCLNHFTKTSCDCIGTGYEGPKCTREVSEAVFLNKTDHIGVKLQPSQGTLKVKMRFKTRNEEGLLLTTSKRGRGFYVAIVDGRIRVSIDNERGFFFGSGTLHDSQWHFLVVSVSSSMLYVELDGKYNERRNIGRKVNVIASPLFIGGLPEDIGEVTPKLPNHFIGCLQQIYVHDINIVYKLIHSRDSRISSTNTLKNKCEMKQESLQEALRRILAEKRSKTTVPPTAKTEAKQDKETIKNSKKKPTPVASKDGKGAGYSKLAVENNKDLIAWISSGIVSGTIVLMIITACAIHYFKYKYESIFVSRMSEQEFNQEQQRTNNSHMLPKQQAVVFLQDKQVSKVVNL